MRLSVCMSVNSRISGVVEYSSLEVSVAAVWLPVNVAFVSMLLTSFMAFKFLNVPVITVFKNVSTPL